LEDFTVRRKYEYKLPDVRVSGRANGSKKKQPGGREMEVVGSNELQKNLWDFVGCRKI